MKPSVAIVGSGNIGTDLLAKLVASDSVEPRWMVGIDPASEGLRRARSLGLEVSADGIDWLLEQTPLPDIVCEATSAHVHRQAAARYRKLGLQAVDLTPAAIGPAVVPPVNLHEHLMAANVNLITCGGQATIPMVYAVTRIVPVDYAEIVSTVSSVSAGPGTRANIDEFTQTTAAGIERIGGARRGKAIIILNPADPPIIMRNSVFCSLPADVDSASVRDSILQMEFDVQQYVPGYRLLSQPQFDPELNRVAIFLEVEGAGDYLPVYAGNLDIMTAAAARVVEEMARATVGVAL
jgi:acetaldehyde dehydrogenase